MSTPTGPASGLPVRMPRPPQPGRHRRPELVAAPVGAPPLVLAVTGTPDSAIRMLAEEVVSIARSELPGLDARIGYVNGDGDAPLDEFPHLRGTLARAAEERPERARRAAEAAREARRLLEEAEAAADPEGAHAEARTERPERVASPAEEEPHQDEAPYEGPDAVVVPLLAGPDGALLDRIRQDVIDSGSTVEMTDVLGPHPLLAEALHVRLSEAGLARADRARLFTVSTAADGIILGTAGGAEAAQAAGITGMLLSARLALPVLVAALDQEGEVSRVAGELRAAGASQLALSPYLIGPEVPGDLPAHAAKEAGCAAAEAIGAYPAVGKLALSKYATLLGIALEPSAATR